MDPTIELLWGSTRVLAAYLESYPRLSATELADGLERGLGRCMWSSRQSGALFACADFEAKADDQVIIRLHAAAGLTDPSAGDLTTVTVRPAKNLFGKRRLSLFACPDCKRSCKHLVYTSRWQCDRCSGLLYRSQRIGSKAAAWEQRDALAKRVEAGRPKGMHNRTFVQLRAKLEQLETKLGPDRARARDEYLLTLESTWDRIPGPPLASRGQAAHELKAEAPKVIAAMPTISPLETTTPSKTRSGWREFDDMDEL